MKTAGFDAKRTLIGGCERLLRSKRSRWCDRGVASESHGPVFETKVL